MRMVRVAQTLNPPKGRESNLGRPERCSATAERRLLDKHAPHCSETGCHRDGCESSRRRRRRLSTRPTAAMSPSCRQLRRKAHIYKLIWRGRIQQGTELSFSAGSSMMNEGINRLGSSLANCQVDASRRQSLDTESTHWDKWLRCTSVSACLHRHTLSHHWRVWGCHTSCGASSVPRCTTCCSCPSYSTDPSCHLLR